MNILICTSSKVYKTLGGTERISSRLAQGFTALGHKCYLAYKHDEHLDNPELCFVDEINALRQSLEFFILEKKIDCVIIQKLTRDVKKMVEIRKKNHLNFKIISVLHFNPSYEEISATFKSFSSGIFRFINFKEYVKDIIRTMAYPIYKLLYPFRNKELYRTVYEYSDEVVLLSKSFIAEYANYSGLNDFDKFEVIPNSLSFDDFLPFESYDSKKEQVLIVSRLEETQKKISIAIKIWAEIEKDQNYKKWKLKIVGDGPDAKKYEEMVKQLHLKRIEFCGHQKNTKKYYQDSQIFLMTSAFEGWGLTLTEAQQMGCIPIAFDTYSSLHDIIENGKNGFIIKKNNVRDYVNKIKLLMRNSDLRKEMSEFSVESSKRFSLQHTIKLWESLISKK